MSIIPASQLFPIYISFAQCHIRHGVEPHYCFITPGRSTIQHTSTSLTYCLSRNLSGANGWLRDPYAAYHYHAQLPRSVNWPFIYSDGTILIELLSYHWPLMQWIFQLQNHLTLSYISATSTSVIAYTTNTANLRVSFISLILLTAVDVSSNVSTALVRI